ncbi:MAG: VTT domain-containing protein [Bacteroidetes bacterium]|nr:VTT domain-containing protein [Bacteroidota bacterium]
MRTIFNWLRNLKEWVENFAQRPGAGWALFVVAFAESSFFPIPPDVLLIALGVLTPKKSFKYALICSVGSVLGGMFGYLIGYQFFELIGQKIISLYGVHAEYAYVQRLYNENAFSAIAIAGFTPIPYKVFTIAAGAFEVSFATLVYASLLSRSARFFLVAALFYVFGPTIKPFIDRYFEILSVIFVVLLMLGFIVIKWLL